MICIREYKSFFILIFRQKKQSNKLFDRFRRTIKTHYLPYNFSMKNLKSKT